LGLVFIKWIFRLNGTECHFNGREFYSFQMGNRVEAPSAHAGVPPRKGARAGALMASPLGVRRDNAALSSGCKAHPANAPAGGNRSSHGGNEMAELRLDRPLSRDRRCCSDEGPIFHLGWRGGCLLMASPSSMRSTGGAKPRTPCCTPSIC
jgi:hypothetical protein